MHFVPCLIHVAPPRKSKSEVVEVSTVDAEPSQTAADPKVMSSPGVTTSSLFGRLGLLVYDRKFPAGTVFFSHTKPAKPASSK